MIKNSNWCLCIVPTWCWAILLLGSSGLPQAVHACDSGSHHSALYHYNRSTLVVSATLLQKKSQPGDDGTPHWTFKVQQSYKSSHILVPSTHYKVVVPPGSAAQLKGRATYLLYLTPQRAGNAWVCERPLPLKDSTTQRQLAVLENLMPQHSGWVVETSPYGRPWAEGRLEQGEPVGQWQYYAYSGELQLQGMHTADSSSWEEYHHTPDATYTILQQIYQGDYHAQTGDYHVLGWDTLTKGDYCYQLRYTVGGDTLVESLVYRTRRLAQRTTYQGLWRHGQELRYDLEGRCVRRYTFWKGWLHGAYWERQTLPRGEQGYIEIEGQYERDQKQTEHHRYYTPDGQLLRERVLMEGGKFL